MQNFSEKVEMTNNTKLGRHYVASVDIAPGEVILEEQPLLITPHWDCPQMKCSNCMQESFVMCKKCQIFPLCVDCTTHNDFDCEFFSSNSTDKISKNFLVANYAIYPVLKMLLLKEKSCKDISIFFQNISLQDYRDSEVWHEHKEHIVKPLLESGIDKMLKNVKLDEDFLQQLCILIDAYAFEVSGKDGDSLKGVYVCGAQFPHNCVPNIVMAFDDEFNMKIYASTTIRSGDVIYNSYTNPMMGTSQRQHQLRMTRRTDCGCKRCLDPTELNTHMSSIKCKACTEGFAVCDMSKSGDWICDKCHTIIEAMAVRKLLADVSEEMVNANGELSAYENLLSKYSSHFHPNHFLLVDMKQNIATILSSLLMNPMGVPAKHLLERKVQLCEEILPVVRAVSPGISKLYAIALFDYLLPFLELADIEFNSHDIAKESFYQKIQLAKEIAAEAAEMLSFEPPNSPEGYLAGRITMEQKRIEENLQKFAAK